MEDAEHAQEQAEHRPSWPTHLRNSRSTRDAGFGSCRHLRRRNEGVKSSSETQCRSFSEGFNVSNLIPGMGELEVPNWHLKFGRGITGGCSLTADLFANGRSRLGDCPLIFLRQGACRHSLDNLGSPRILGLLAIRDALCV